MEINMQKMRMELWINVASGIAKNWNQKNMEACSKWADRILRDFDERFDKTQQTHDAISAIERALRIKDLWGPPNNITISKDDPHYGEYQALQQMVNLFESIVQKQHHA